MATNDDLIAILKQKIEETSNQEVAAKIGISHAQLSRLIHGQRRPGWKTLAGIVQAYPELHPYVSLFLSQKLHIGNN